MADPHFHHQTVSWEMFKRLQSTRAPGGQVGVHLKKASKAGVPLLP